MELYMVNFMVYSVRLDRPNMREEVAQGTSKEDEAEKVHQPILGTDLLRNVQQLNLGVNSAERVGEKRALGDLRNGAKEYRVEAHVEEKVQLSQDHQNDASNVQDSQPLLSVAYLLGHINSCIELRMLT